MALRRASSTVVLVLAANLASWAYGENGTVALVPPIPAMAASGIQLQIDTRGVDGNGYRPIRVQIRTANGMPTLSERAFRIQMAPDGRYWQPNYTFEKTVTLPMGASFVDAEIPVRQAGYASSLDVFVFENGRRLNECRGHVQVSRKSEYTEMWPTMLFIDSKAPSRGQQERIRRNGRLAGQRAEFVDYRAIASLSPVSETKRKGQPTETPAKQFFYGKTNRPRVGDVLNALQGEAKCSMAPFSDLPKNWRDLSVYDLAFISFSDAQSMATTNPRAWQALADWTRSGHSLFIYRDAEQPLDAALSAIDQKLRGQFRDWQVATSSREDYLEDYELANSNRNAKIRYNQPAMKSRNDVRIRDCGLGRVIYVDGNPFEMTYAQRVALLNVIGIRNWAWRERNGVSMLSQNSVYWSQLIPGLGLPPVNLFLISMTAFVIVIGPVSYYTLKKRRLLFLIMIIAPVASGLMVLGLVLFAFMSDGVGMKTRVRGVTYLDGSAGRAASLSYQTYYSAMGGGAELRFPSDATVFPVDFQTHDDVRRGQQFVSDWNDGQRLRAGYVRPRTMTQFLVSRSASTSMTFEVAKQGEGYTATNGLGADVHFAFVRGDDGEFYWAEQITPGGSVDLAKIPAPDLAARTRELLAKAELKTPPGFDENAYLRFSSNYYYGQSSDHGFGAAKYSTSILERKLDELLTMPGQLPVGSFVTVVEFSRAAPVGTESPRRHRNIEVVYGRWK